MKEDEMVRQLKRLNNNMVVIGLGIIVVLLMGFMLMVK